jgi:hypothetical protein
MRSKKIVRESNHDYKEGTKIMSAEQIMTTEEHKFGLWNKLRLHGEQKI